MTDSPILSLQRQYELLQMEYEYEKEQFRQQTELMGIGRKVKTGHVLVSASSGTELL